MVVDVVYNPLLQLQECGLERLSNLLHGTWEKVVKPESDSGAGLWNWHRRCWAPFFLASSLAASFPHALASAPSIGLQACLVALNSKTSRLSVLFGFALSSAQGALLAFFF